MIEIVPYDPAWPGRYADEAELLRRALGAVAERIEHVGSTAVPGLAAKPYIDVQVSVRSFDPFAAYGRPLAGLGYVHRADPALPEHRFFERTTFHVHVCETGGAWERRHLAFRDHLRSNPGAAEAYELHKRDLARRFDRSADYAEAKTPFIRAVERELGL